LNGNAYQYSLLYWFTKVIQQRNIIGINIEAIYSGTRSKNSRILDMFKQLTAGEIGFSEAVRSEVLMEITGFNPLKTNNIDNTLDLLTYAPRVLSEMAHYLLVNGEVAEKVEVISAAESANRCTF
jgi:hypothetical protein